MGSNAPDTSGWVDLSQLTPDSVPLDLSVQDAALIPPSPGGTPAGTDATGGLGTIGDVVSVLTQFAQFLAQNVASFDRDPVLHFLQQATEWVNHVQILALLHPEKLWRDVIQGGPGSVIRGMLELGLGVDTSKWDKDANAGLNTADGIVGFSMLLNLAIAAVDTFGEGLLANRWGKVGMDAIRTLPEEMGLSWALGIIISDSFKAAIGTQLEAAIYKAKRPNEPEWQIARAMVRQHVISDEDLTTILEHSGFSDPWIEKIKKLETQPLPVGDIAAMYQAEIIDAEEITPLLRALGFTDQNVAHLRDLYIDKADTQAGSVLRATARQLYRDGKITQDEYRGYLSSTNFPGRLIADDIEAIALEQRVGWRQQNTGVIKSQVLHGSLTDDAAASQLVGLGMARADAVAMVASWHAPPIRRQHGLSQAQVLKYLIAGLLTPDQAQTDLQALGVDSTTIAFLLAHPTAQSGARVVKLTPALVTEAYLVGAIQHSDLESAYTKAGVKGDVLAYQLAVAEHKYATHHEPGSGTNLLTDADIREAFKLGLMDQPTSIAALQANGWSQEHAILLLEITMKGPLTDNGLEKFHSVGEAIALLQADGFIVYAPPDPYIMDAERMVEMAGYSIQPPPNYTPTPVPVGGGLNPPPGIP